MNMNFNKSQAIDYLKAIGIILVVIGHYPLSPFNVITPYMFHMPLFFFIGGMLFSGRKKTIEIIKNGFNKYVLYILYTYVTIGFIVVLFNFYFRVSIGSPFSGGLINFLFVAVASNFSNNPFFVVAWFLLAYLGIMILFHVINSIACVIKDEKSKKAFLFFLAVFIGWVGVNFLAVEYKETQKQIYNYLSQVTVGMMFYVFGFVFKEIIWSWVNITTCMLLFSFLYVLEQYGMVSPYTMSQSQYPQGILSMIISTMICIYLTVALSRVLSAFKESKMLLEIGRESKVIMSYHLIAFLIIDLFVSFFGVLDMSYVSVFNHYAEKWTWPVYIIGGIALPLLGLKVYLIFIKIVKSFYCELKVTRVV
ncbi:acyltransferase family protein [Aeromonas veronii]|uniref:acyltransferase family protein n=1 Tax=Aeromonas veronii TaxID=654 RepID=UPI003BA2DA3D